MKCMGDFGEGYLVDAGNDSFEQEMGFKIKIKKPKFSSFVPKPVAKVVTAVTKPVTSVTSAIVKNPVAAVTTGVAATLVPAAMVASVVPGVNKITAPVTDTIKAAAMPVTQVVAPVVAAPLSVVSPSIAQQVVTTAMPTMPKMPTMVEEQASEGQPILDTAPAAILTSDSAPAATLVNTAPAATINSQGQAVLDTTPATIISSTSTQKEEKKGNAGAIIGGLAVAGIAAYMFMKD